MISTWTTQRIISIAEIVRNAKEDNPLIVDVKIDFAHARLVVFLNMNGALRSFSYYLNMHKSNHEIASEIVSRLNGMLESL